MTKIMITGLVIVHLAASLWQGSAHTHLGIELSTGLRKREPLLNFASLDRTKRS